MKKIEAIIEPVQFHDVKEALSAAGVTDLTTSEVRGVDPLGRHTETYRGVEYTVDLIPKIKIEAVVADELGDCVISAISAITDGAATPSGRSGRIFVSHVEEGGALRGGSRARRAVHHVR